MKIIFLDIDGVLNSTQFYENKSNYELLEEPFDRNNALQLKRIVEQTGAEVVLTSTWRGGWDRNPVLCTLEGKLLNQLFSSLGLQIYDKTPVLREGRSAEIRQYLKSCREKVSAYVIIDDNDFHWKQNGFSRHVVQTDFEDGGLKAEHADQAIAILNRKRFLF